MRIEPGKDGVSIWSPEIFGTSEASRVQDFLSRTFAVAEVQRVELRRTTSFGRVLFGVAANPRQIWKKLSRALGASSDGTPAAGKHDGRVRKVDASLLYLDGAGTAPVHVSRVGASLSTWRVRHQGDNTLRLWHPVLRNRRDVVFRLEEELASILGIEDFRASALTAAVTIRFDRRALTVEHLATALEKAWPRVLDGLEGPPSRKRFFVAGGLVGLSFVGQYLVPVLRPFAVAGVALYSLPNVFKAVKEARRGEIGIYALYSTGLGFLLLSGLPFASAAIAVLMQFWPHWARRKFVTSQRRLFAPHRRRAVWARIPKGNGVDVEVSVDDLREGDLVVVHGGETVPVDGVVHEGSAVVAVEGTAIDARHVNQRSRGDWIGAGAFVRDGSLTIRVERTGVGTSAGYIASLLPHAPLAGMPSLIEAERIANRNAKAALALSGLSLFVTRTLRRSQAVIRPDYVTAPRLSAELSVLHGLAHGAQQGIFFRNPAALDRLTGADVYIIDETAGLDRRRVEVAAVQAVNGVAEAVVAGYALIAGGKVRTEPNRALAAFTASLTTLHPEAEHLHHHAGVTRYRDRAGSAIDVATTEYVGASKSDVPKAFQRTLAQHAKASGHAKQAHDDEASLRPLWVSRDGQIIGVVSFARTGELVGKEVVAAIRAKNKRARFVYLSRGKKAEVHALAEALGIERSYGGLDDEAKASLLRGIGRPTVWVGDGSARDVKASVAASTVSISVASYRHSSQDVADILLPGKGLEALPVVVDLGRDHDLRLARDYRTVYTANLAGVGGAFLARFGALHTGLLSNVGTGLVYARRARGLDRLAAAVDDDRARLTVSPAP